MFKLFEFFGPMAKFCILQALTTFKDFAWKKNSKKKQNLQFSSNFRLNLRHVFNLYFAQNIFFWLLQVQENIFHTLIIFLATLELAPRALQKSKVLGKNIFSNFFPKIKNFNFFYFFLYVFLVIKQDLVVELWKWPGYQNCFKMFKDSDLFWLWVNIFIFASAWGQKNLIGLKK